MLKLERLLQDIHAYIDMNPLGFKEYDLIQHLVTCNPLIGSIAEDGNLELFKKHFLTMNGLYRLQEKYWKEQGRFLNITSVWIQLEPPSERNSISNELTDNSSNQKLKEYYLEWDNYYQATEETVEELLTAFWQHFHKLDQRDSALAMLDLSCDATSSEIKQRYKELAALHHPDKGGDVELFIQVRAAYENLK
ncbi:DNA-J related domain-containing protein [Neptuniibacter sp.]|uniref:DNA-J related domain-containing protein n=1 Tax=Neptuniibacter sp. TaxID=1962643 RepID=UPI00262E33D9|nr:DNA-J related domain-containing protein [Neptuniibacter sp.]MCP4596741.1 DnaJ domain-containing protein [Neptuniibacter sp.]